MLPTSDEIHRRSNLQVFVTFRFREIPEFFSRPAGVGDLFNGGGILWFIAVNCLGLVTADRMQQLEMPLEKSFLNLKKIPVAKHLRIISSFNVQNFVNIEREKSTSARINTNLSQSSYKLQGLRRFRSHYILMNWVSAWYSRLWSYLSAQYFWVFCYNGYAIYGAKNLSVIFRIWPVPLFWRNSPTFIFLKWPPVLFVFLLTFVNMFLTYMFISG